MLLSRFTIWCAALLLLALQGCAPASLRQHPGDQLSRTSETRYVMGTLLEITLFTESGKEGRRIIELAFNEAQRLDRVLSNWKPDSVVSTFNRLSSTEQGISDRDLYEIVSRSNELSALTDGAFAITVRPLVELWSDAVKKGAVPSPQSTARALGCIKPNLIALRAPDYVIKRHRCAMLESGGIGKGFAVDRMIDILRTNGVTSAFVNLGRSSIAAIGAPPGASGWSVTLALDDRSKSEPVILQDETLSIARAQGTPFKINGRSYAHIFEPLTGTPVTSLRGAAVRSKSATVGEALVKYLVIRGAPKPSLAARWGGAQWIVHDPPAPAQRQ